MTRFGAYAVLRGSFACALAGTVACATTNSEGNATAGAGASGGAAGSGAAGAAGSGDGGSAGGSGIFDDACAVEIYGGVLQPGSILLVVDISGSMTRDNKWSDTQAAVSEAIVDAPDELEMGVTFFPKPGSPSNCSSVWDTPGVAVAPLSSTRNNILNAIGMQTPNGSTPTRQALLSAYDTMSSLQTNGERFVLLMTDGDPDIHTNTSVFEAECGSYADMWTESSQMRDGMPSVKTFVVGSPGVLDYGFLSRLAVAGGTARDPACDPASGCETGGNCCHYQIGSFNFQDQLTDVLREINGAIQGCTFAIPQGDDVDPDKVNVVVRTSDGDTELSRDASEEDGWNYADASETSVTLFGPECERVKSDHEAEVLIVVGCATIIR